MVASLCSASKNHSFAEIIEVSRKIVESASDNDEGD
jgi:hypothetical protein